MRAVEQPCQCLCRRQRADDRLADMVARQIGGQRHGNTSLAAQFEQSRRQRLGRDVELDRRILRHGGRHRERCRKQCGAQTDPRQGCPASPCAKRCSTYGVALGQSLLPQSLFIIFF
jgi:hypothetical protein